VLLNLLGNAVKFTSEGEVNVTCASSVARSPESVTVELSVRDTGHRDERRDIGHLFDAFTQAESSTARRYGGTGLGLAISRQLVELMGGVLECDEQTRARGAPSAPSSRSRWVSDVTTGDGCRRLWPGCGP
jgi:two-component system sensor histidine kinase/response regulator